jgi:hypothetical protein
MMFSMPAKTPPAYKRWSFLERPVARMVACIEAEALFLIFPI